MNEDQRRSQAWLSSNARVIEEEYQPGPDYDGVWFGCLHSPFTRRPFVAALGL